MQLTYYDFAMLAIVAYCAIQGAWKGMAWQIAPIASLIVGYIVATPMSTAAATYFGQPPTNHLLALLSIYALVALAVYLMVRSIRESIEKLKLTELDHHMGFVFGAIKGVLFSLIVTVAIVTASPSARESILSTESGSVARQVVAIVDPILPPGIHDQLAPYLKNLNTGGRSGAVLSNRDRAARRLRMRELDSEENWEPRSRGTGPISRQPERGRGRDSWSDTPADADLNWNPDDERLADPDTGFEDDVSPRSRTNGRPASNSRTPANSRTPSTNRRPDRLDEVPEFGDEEFDNEPAPPARASSRNTSGNRGSAPDGRGGPPRNRPAAGDDAEADSTWNTDNLLNESLEFGRKLLGDGQTSGRNMTERMRDEAGNLIERGRSTGRELIDETRQQGSGLIERGRQQGQELLRKKLVDPALEEFENRLLAPVLPPEDETELAPPPRRPRATSRPTRNDDL